MLGSNLSVAGTVTVQAYQMILPERPTPAELTASLAGVKDQVKIALVGKHVFVPVNLNPRSSAATINRSARSTTRTTRMRARSAQEGTAVNWSDNRR